MQYNGETNDQDICTVCDDLAGTDDSSYPLKKKTRAANMGMREIWSWIFQVYGGWIYDDSNQTDLPEATRSLAASQQFYALPTDSSALLGVSWKDTAGNWTKLKPITLEQIQERCAEEEFEDTPGNPIYYRPLANGVKLYPAANFSQNASLASFFARDISAFIPTDQTKYPGFDKEFHEAIAVYMALHYADINQLDVAKSIRKKWSNDSARDPNYPDGFEQRIKKHYRTRFAQFYPKAIEMPDPVEDYR